MELGRRVSMRARVLALIIVMLPISALAQGAVDWCGSPLEFQADPNTALLWRLRCTIQVLDRERAESEDHVTTAEIDKAVAEAHLKAAQAELAKTKSELDDVKKKLPSPTPEKKN